MDLKTQAKPAISDLCGAVKALAHALDSACWSATISNNVITCQPGGTGIDIHPEGESSFAR